MSAGLDGSTQSDDSTTAMTYQPESARPLRPAFNNSVSTSWLPTIHESAQDVVPSGTVANRVRFLQNLAIPNISAPPPPVSNRPRENSRTGYGRRISNRFGPPAVRGTGRLTDPGDMIPSVTTAAARGSDL